MKMIPLAKQSKRKRSEFYAAHRGRWDGVCPITRVAPNRKGYDRCRAKQAARRETQGL